MEASYHGKQGINLVNAYARRIKATVVLNKNTAVIWIYSIILQYISPLVYLFIFVRCKIIPVFLRAVNLEMSRSHSSLQLCLVYCLYERATRVKPYRIPYQ